MNEVKIQLQKCKTLGEMLKVIEKHYEVEKCVLSPITKATVINGLGRAVQMTRCEQRKK